MSLVSRLRQHFPIGFFKSPNFNSLIKQKPLISVSRNFAQPARIEEEDDEEIEIDHRRLPADYDPANFDPAEHRSPPAPRVFTLVDEVSSLTLVEVSQLASILTKKTEMKEPLTVGFTEPGGAVKGPAAAKEEKKPEKTAIVVME